MIGRYKIGAYLLVVLFFFLSVFPSQGMQPRPFTKENISCLSSLPLSMELTWNSQNNKTKSNVFSGDTLSGDHVVLHAIFNETALDGDIKSAYLFLQAIDNQDEPTRAESWLFPGYGSRLDSDTYIIGRNATVSATFSVETSTDSVYTCQYEEIAISNFFSPKISEISVTGEGAIKTISWNVIDPNLSDTYSVSVYVSSDLGESFQLLMTNITDDSWQWDSTGYLIRDYIIMVEAEDSSGLSSQKETHQFSAGTVDTRGPTYVTLQIDYDGPDDFSYVFGSTGNFISWNPNTTLHAAYIISRGGVEISEGLWTGGIISINIDGLDIGVYSFCISMSVQTSNPAIYLGSDEVLVEVVSGLPLLMASYSITGVSVFVIIIVLIQFYKFRKKDLG